MRLLNIALALGIAGLGQTRALDRVSGQPSSGTTRGVRLETLSWTDAERHLGSDAVVVIPVGAAAKEHGPHLKLRNDLTLADYLTGRITATASVVAAPALTYHFYPAFLDYPGSTSLGFNTARDLTVDVVRTLARHGPRRFYVLNTGISTRRPLEAAAKILAAEGVLLHFTDLEARLDGSVKAIQQQPGGTHADEIETSMMLYIDPAAVDMTKAVRDYVPAPAGTFRLTRTQGGAGTYSPTGIWGDPTLATRDKGRVLVEALVSGILDDIDSLRKAALPPAATPAPSAVPAPATASTSRGPAVAAEVCSGFDERVIRNIGPAFTLAWRNQDARQLADLWSPEGDIVHPDGSVERTPTVIRQNRAYLFAQDEYKSSRHSLGVGHIRCVARDVAIADGKWELREVVDGNGRSVPPMNGLCTLVLKRTGSNWAIEAYRYTIAPRTGTPPTVLKQPGFLDR
jgi:creatinine amidohydrolase